MKTTLAIWSVEYRDPNEGIPLKELYDKQRGHITEEGLIREIKAGRILSAQYIGELKTT